MIYMEGIDQNRILRAMTIVRGLFDAVEQLIETLKRGGS